MEKQYASISVICPLYNGKPYIRDLHRSLLSQKDVSLNEVRYVVTDTGDGIEKELEQLEKAVFRVIRPAEFSHSLTREQEAFRSESDILVFITQDIKILGDLWLKNLVTPIMEGECEASYSRQICTNRSIERYTRESNYPPDSIIKTKDSIASLGFHTFFFSDASSAVRKDVFVKLNGYDGKDFPSNEDEYLAYKLIMNGYRVRYCADSVVDHSHEYTLKQLYSRYYATGRFFRMNPYLNDYGTGQSGAKLAAYIFKRALEERNFKALLRFLPDMAARYLGMKAGRSL